MSIVINTLSDINVRDTSNIGKASASSVRPPLQLEVLAMTALAVALVAITANSQPEKIVLRCADFLPTNHLFSVGKQAWMKRVTELTDGPVSFQCYLHE